MSTILPILDAKTIKRTREELRTLSESASGGITHCFQRNPDGVPEDKPPACLERCPVSYAENGEFARADISPLSNSGEAKLTWESAHPTGIS